MLLYAAWPEMTNGKRSNLHCRETGHYLQEMVRSAGYTRNGLAGSNPAGAIACKQKKKEVVKNVNYPSPKGSGFPPTKTKGFNL